MRSNKCTQNTVYLVPGLNTILSVNTNRYTWYTGTAAAVELERRGEQELGAWDEKNYEYVRTSAETNGVCCFWSSLSYTSTWYITGKNR